MNLIKLSLPCFLFTSFLIQNASAHPGHQHDQGAGMAYHVMHWAWLVAGILMVAFGVAAFLKTRRAANEANRKNSVEASQTQQP